MEMEKIGLELKMPIPSWQYGSLIITKAFGGLPADIKEWDITLWRTICRQAEEILKAPSI